MEWFLFLVSVKTLNVRAFGITPISYLEIGAGTFKDAMGTFQQWLALKIWVRYKISIVLLLMSSCKVFSGYV